MTAGTGPVPDAAAPAALHRDVRLLAAVGLGGAVGTGARAALSWALPTAEGAWPWATFAANITGAFALGALLAWLVAYGPGHSQHRTRARVIRAAVGAGLLGSWTTYSALAVETVALHHSGETWMAGSYVVATVALGFVAAWAGARLVRVMAGRRTSPVGGAS